MEKESFTEVAEKGLVTRESWLEAMAEKLRPFFAEVGLPLPANLKISCGWPSRGGMSMVKPVIGECWPWECSEGELTEIFMSPRYSDGVLIGATLAHELLHAAIGVDKKHGIEFRKGMAKIGLTGKATATEPGPELIDRLKVIISQIGDYPHFRINPKVKIKKDGTRMRKIVCENCGYSARTTKKWIEVGLPTCPCGTAMTDETEDEIED